MFSKIIGYINNTELVKIKNQTQVVKSCHISKDNGVPESEPVGKVTPFSKESISLPSSYATFNALPREELTGTFKKHAALFDHLVFH